MPSTVLLPTPLPAKMPTRWPRPSVSSVSMARTPLRARRRSCPGAEDSAAADTASICTPCGASGALVDRHAEAVDHAAQQLPPGNDVRALARRDHFAADLDADEVFVRHQQHAPLGEADDFRERALAAGARRDLADFAEARIRTFGFDRQADGARRCVRCASPSRRRELFEQASGASHDSSDCDARAARSVA